MQTRHLSALIVLATLAAVALVAPAGAATPNYLPLDGALLSAGGGPVPDGKYAIVFSLYDCTKPTDWLWKEFDAGVPIANGRFSYLLGKGDPKNPLKLEYFKDAACLGVAVAGEAELPKVPLGAVAYSLLAAWAAKADHATVASGLDKPLEGSQIAANSIDSQAIKFTYAGSASKGGPASDVQCSGCVGEGDIGPNSVMDDHVFFKYAVSNKKGGSALQALDLQCTGCVATEDLADGAVTLVKLHADVAKGFLSVKGGALESDLDLGGNQLLNARMHNGAAKDFKCDGANAGGLFFDTTAKRLTFCDGKNPWKLAICTPGVGCANPEPTPCGTLVVDVCGDATCGGVKGSKCDKGQVCLADKCLDAPASCKEWLAKNVSLQNGNYLIDPDGAGGVAPITTYCDMGAGGFTLVHNVFDSGEDDMPNTYDFPYAGWQQVKSGVWDKGVTEIKRQVGTNVSASMAPSLIRTMWLKGASVLKACFVAQDGSSEVCRSSDTAGAVLTIAVAPENVVNPELQKLRKSACSDGPACDAAYTYGRLAGIPGSTGDPAPGALGHSAFCIQRTPGATADWGSDGNGTCEHNTQNGHWGVWHGWGCGPSYRPQLANDEEIGFTPGSGCGGANPSNYWGFRMYVK